jgi:parallel beta-helix repeat protein
MSHRLTIPIIICLVILSLTGLPVAAQSRLAPSGITYYVSSSLGNDSNNGLSENSPYASVGKVNSLELQPGDIVRFKCGDTWRTDPLNITRSGSAGQPITFTSYPSGCSNQPVLSGTQQVSGWALAYGSIYVTDLAVGANAGKFAYGVNQLFRQGTRLRLGRWPNLDAGDGGYSTIDGQPANDRFNDNELPSGDWNGAVAHIKGMRWYILNREVTGSSLHSITVGESLDCWDGNCTGWGYFLNNHLNTLDQEGEWYYDTSSHRLYLYTTGGVPGDGLIEGSVVLHADDRSWGGIVLGEDLGDEISFITIENLSLRGWFRHGIATPTNLAHYEIHDLVIQKNTIRDVDSTGINLGTWVYDPWDERLAGWRGGYNLTIRENSIQRVNRMGIDSYARESTISENSIQDVGLIENLGAAGLGCGFDAGGGLCTEDGDGIRIKVDQASDTGNYMLIKGNRLERIAYNGMDVFGHHNTLQYNFIRQACYAKGDCGGVRTFGSEDIDNTSVHDLLFDENLILNTSGNTNGCHTTYRAEFGFGLYIDHYSRNVTLTGNTIISSTVSGILYQDSTGVVMGNTLYNNSRGTMYSAQETLTSSPTYVSQHTGNILFSLQDRALTLYAADNGRLGTSDGNYFFNPYLEEHIQVDNAYSLAGWQTYSGKDASSKDAWFSLVSGQDPNSVIFYNDTSETKTIDLGYTLYLDLDQNPVYGSLALQPYQSKVLVISGEAADLALSMTLIGTPDTSPGAPLTYTLTIENEGWLGATEIVLTHPIIDEIVNTSWEASVGGVSLQAGTRYTWNLPDLAPGKGLTITVSGTYANTIQPGETLLLGAEVTTATPDMQLSNNQAWLRLGVWHPIYLSLIQK